MIFNSDMTIYNKYFDPKDRLDKYQRTQIKKVFWQEKHAMNRITSGFQEADRVLVLIPFYRHFSREYIRPYKFRQTKDIEDYCTIQEGDIIVRGLVDEELTNIRKFREKHDVFTITSVDINDFGRKHMQHFKVGAK